MAEIVSWLRGQFPEVNFVSVPEVDDVPVRMTLRNATLDDIFTALRITIKGELIADPMNEKMVSFYYLPAQVKSKPARKISRAYSLANYLAHRSPEEADKALKELEEALNLTWEMMAQANPDDRNFRAPQLNLHGPTKLLIAVGDFEQLEIIGNFVNQLEGHATPRILPARTFAPAGVPGSAPAVPPGIPQNSPR